MWPRAEPSAWPWARGEKARKSNRPVPLSTAPAQLAGEQPHAGQGGGGAGHAGVRHHQRQDQAARRAEDQDPGGPVGMYVRSPFDALAEI